jgi:general stress protein 26
MGETAPTQAEKLATLREIIRETDICMLTTVDEDGSLRSRPMSNNRDVEFDGDLWFFTYGSSPKAQEIGREHQVCASFADVRHQRYVSLTGTATLVTDKAKLAELWKPTLKAWFPEGLETPGLALLKVSAQRAEYWDGDRPLVQHLVNFAKALIKKEEADLGTNEKLELGA